MNEDIVKQAAALSAAEPVSANLNVFVCYDGVIFATENSAKEYCKDRNFALGGMGYNKKPLRGDFTHTAPSVAVKALEWFSQQQYVLADTAFGTYRILGDIWWFENGKRNRAKNVEEAKAAAQSDYEARIRSALSAQVQDAEGLNEEMSLAVALDFADNPRPYHTLQAPADTNGELYRALKTITAAYRSAQVREVKTFINLNARVRVKLTEHGKIILAMDEYATEKPDENGFIEMQFWELMRVFGPVMFNGNPNLPFEENVLELLG